MPIARSGLGDVALHTVVDAADRDILEALLVEPGLGTSLLADRVGLSAANVSRRLHRLQRTGVLRVVGRTAPGFGNRTVRLSRLHGSPVELERLVVRLRTDGSATWVRLSRDRTQLFVGSSTTAMEPDPGIALAIGDASLRLECHELLRVWTSRPSVLTPPRSLDQVDLALLDVLAEDGRMTSAMLGERLGVDATTASRRRHRLMDDGVLYLEAIVHPAALGPQGDCMVWLGVAPGHIRRLGDALRRLPQVRFVAATSGTTQLVATIALPTGSLVDLLDEQLDDPAVRSLDTVPLHQGILARS